jgi:hypothetical protein
MGKSVFESVWNISEVSLKDINQEEDEEGEEEKNKYITFVD